MKMFLATSWLNYLIAAALWERLFSHAHVVYYIDNESSHVAYIRGDGETVKASSLIQSVVQVESDLHHRGWFGRVPSRLEFYYAISLSATRTSIDWETISNHLGPGRGAELGRC